MKNRNTMIAVFINWGSLFAKFKTRELTRRTVDKPKLRFGIFTLITLFALNLAINATPSTQIWIPSTDIQGFKTFHLGIDNYTRTDKIDGIRGAGATPS